ncbi:MAG: hypothetical protein J0M04_19090 [Verrucomicrobia bacterium]|nr:hypothetical protein [Verrucomicrobiota bacterium]
MSYNLDIMKLRDFTSKTFPVALDDAPHGFVAVPWLKLRAFLKENGAREGFDEHHLLVDFENFGCLEICGVRDPSGESEDFVLIGFDVHTYWTHVLEIYKKALEFDPLLVLFDPQQETYHNASTFESLAIIHRESQMNKDDVEQVVPPNGPKPSNLIQFPIQSLP